MMKRSRRTKALSSADLRLVARIARPRKVLHPLQQVIHLDVGVAVVAVLDLRALAEQGIGLVEEQDRAAALGRVKMLRRFFSVSPMYLLTTPARSMR